MANVEGDLEPKIMRFLWEHELNEMIKRAKSQILFYKIPVDDMVRVLETGWNNVVIGYLLYKVHQYYLIEFGTETVTRPVHLDVDSLADLAEDDKPIIKRVFAELVPEMIKLKLVKNDLLWLLPGEIFRPGVLRPIKEKLRNLQSVVDAQRFEYDVFSRNLYEIPDSKGECKGVVPSLVYNYRKNIDQVSKNCKKFLLWDDDGAALKSMLNSVLSAPDEDVDKDTADVDDEYIRNDLIDAFTKVAIAFRKSIGEWDKKTGRDKLISTVAAIVADDSTQNRDENDQAAAENDQNGDENDQHEDENDLAADENDHDENGQAEDESDHNDDENDQEDDDNQVEDGNDEDEDESDEDEDDSDEDEPVYLYYV